MNLFAIQNNEFAHRHIGPDEHETKEMLGAIGIHGMGDLISRTVPDGIRMDHRLRLPEAISEAAYLAQLAVIQQHDATDRLGGLTVPTLVLAGEQDLLIPTALSHDLHELVPGSRWATTAGGHGCVWEHPDAFNTAFIRFLDSIERTDA